MNAPAGKPEPPGARWEAHAYDQSRIYQANRDIHITYSVPAAGHDSAAPGTVRSAAARMVLPSLLLLTGVVLLGVGYRTGDTIAALVGAGLGMGAVPLLSSGVRRWRLARLRYRPDLLRDQVNAAAARLALDLRAQSEREERVRRLQHPSPLTVRWTTEEVLSDHWSSIRADDGSDEPLDLSGDIRSVADVYARVPSGRLLLLGPAGAGKSVLALRFTLDRLRQRADGDRIPVILPLASWDPATQDLYSWGAQRLAADHPALAVRTVTGSLLAAELLRAGRLLPVLDGFDEMHADARPEALRRLRAGLGRADPFVMTSRVDEYAAAVREADAVLPATAAVRLQPLDLDQVADYLRRTTRRMAAGETVSTKWDPVFAYLRDHSRAAQARALSGMLSTPLMTALARTAYSDTGGDPAELLDGRRFPTRASLEDHLVDQLIPAVADHPEKATRWLTFLALRLHAQQTQDLAWWRLGRAAPTAVRILGMLLSLGAVTAVMRRIFGDAGTLLFGLPLWTAFGLLCATALLDAALLPPAAGVPAPRRFGRPASIPRFLLGAAVWLAGGLLVGVRLWELHPAVVLLVCAAVLSERLHPPVRTESANSPGQVLRDDRRSALASLGLAHVVRLVDNPLWASPGGAVPGTGGDRRWPTAVLLLLAAARVDWPVMAGVALAGLLVYGMSRSAWSAFAMARVWPWLTGRLPWRLLDFLEDAHRRGILRQSGAFYQFRHARLQERLVARSGRPAFPRQAPGRSVREAVRSMRSATRFVLTYVLLLGTPWMSVALQSAPGPVGRAGPRTVIPLACELLRPQDLSAVVPAAEMKVSDRERDESLRDNCWWFAKDGWKKGNPSVWLQTYGPYEPVPGHSAVQAAAEGFDFVTGEPEEGLEPPAGLGDRAVTTIEWRGPSPQVRTTVLIDNVVLSASFTVGIERQDEQTYRDLAKITHDLARAAVRHLGT
ncbi:hypothetical protein GCM10010129_68220 [Streptomyces fumigatiscleroticus]|nr:hypothetical protein GCM10010129_68220 [Streptomyces fumigatiscleroticus]